MFLTPFPIFKKRILVIEHGGFQKIAVGIQQFSDFNSCAFPLLVFPGLTFFPFKIGNHFFKFGFFFIGEGLFFYTFATYGVFFAISRLNDEIVNYSHPSMGTSLDSMLQSFWDRVIIITKPI
jgi:hypothetical protein